MRTLFIHVCAPLAFLGWQFFFFSFLSLCFGASYYGCLGASKPSLESENLGGAWRWWWSASPLTWEWVRQTLQGRREAERTIAIAMAITIASRRQLFPSFEPASWRLTPSNG